MANIYKSIKHPYENQTYLSKYGSDSRRRFDPNCFQVVAYYQTMKR